VGIAAALGSLPGKSLFNMLDRFLSERYPRAHVFHKYSALIPLAAGESFFRQPACGSDWLLVGDAAGHVDPLLGEGISFALKSAECAAQAILSGNIPTYEALWRERYGNMLADRASVRRTLSVLGRALAMEVLAEMVFQSIAA